MIIYRVLGEQNKIEQGWFAFRYNYSFGDHSLYWLSNKWLEDRERYLPTDLHRPPCDDPGIRDFWNKECKKGSERDWYCAFQTKEHLTNVFRSEDHRAYMSEICVRLAVFKVLKKNLRFGEDQCLFLLRDAYDITYHPLSHIESC